MSTEQIARNLEKATAGKRLLDHPFYRAWADGSLTIEDLSFYSSQYWRQVEAFPGYLGSLIERMEPGSAREIVEANLADERDDDHPALWRQFAEGLGCDEAALETAAVEPETERCVAAFSQGSRSASLPFALGMLYGYESQTPEVAHTKVAGLREHYGIDGEPLRYFELHGELDVEHTGALVEAIDQVAVTDADRDEAEAGARAGAAAIYGLLDGVARARKLVPTV